MIYLGLAGEVREDGSFALEQKNKFSVGEEIEIMKPDGSDIPAVVEGIWSEDGVPQESAPHARQRLWVRLSVTPQPFDVLRKKAK